MIAAGLARAGAGVSERPRPGLHLCSREGDSTVYEVSSRGPDPRLQGVGADPWGGVSQSYLQVPLAPTPDRQSRYLFRLAAIGVGVDEELTVLGFRQGVRIGLQIYPEGSANAEANVIELDQSTPWFRFPDGNISWHLMVMTGQPRLARPVRVGLGEGLSSDVYGLAPALLCSSYDDGEYVPPGKGIPPGDPLGSLGNFWDVRAPFASQATAVSEGHRVCGPAQVALFCSVRQTNPARSGRASAPPVLTPPLQPETLFLAHYPNAVYRAVAGSLLVRVRSL